MVVEDLRGHALPIALTVAPFVLPALGCWLISKEWNATGAYLIIVSLLWVLSWQA